MNVKNKIQQLKDDKLIKDDKLAYLIVVLRKKNGGKFGRRIPLIFAFCHHTFKENAVCKRPNLCMS